MAVRQNGISFMNACLWRSDSLLMKAAFPETNFWISVDLDQKRNSRINIAFATFMYRSPPKKKKKKNGLVGGYMDLQRLIKQFLIVSNLVLLTFSVYQETLGQIRRFSISLSQLGSWPQCYPNIDKKELGPVDPLLSLLLSGHLHSHVVLAWEMILKINQMLKGLPWSPISTPFGGASCSSNLLQTWFYMTCCMFWVLFQWY